MKSIRSSKFFSVESNMCSSPEEATAEVIALARDIRENTIRNWPCELVKIEVCSTKDNKWFATGLMVKNTKRLDNTLIV